MKKVISLMVMFCVVHAYAANSTIQSLTRALQYESHEAVRTHFFRLPQDYSNPHHPDQSTNINKYSWAQYALAHQNTETAQKNIDFLRQYGCVVKPTPENMQYVINEYFSQPDQNDTSFNSLQERITYAIKQLGATAPDLSHDLGNAMHQNKLDHVQRLLDLKARPFLSSNPPSNSSTTEFAIFRALVKAGANPFQPTTWDRKLIIHTYLSNMKNAAERLNDLIAAQREATGTSSIEDYYSQQCESCWDYHSGYVVHHSHTRKVGIDMAFKLYQEEQEVARKKSEEERIKREQDEQKKREIERARKQAQNEEEQKRQRAITEEKRKRQHAIEKAQAQYRAYAQCASGVDSVNLDQVKKALAVGVDTYGPPLINLNGAPHLVAYAQCRFTDPKLYHVEILPVEVPPIEMPPAGCCSSAATRRRIQQAKERERDAVIKVRQEEREAAIQEQQKKIKEQQEEILSALGTIALDELSPLLAKPHVQENIPTDICKLIWDYMQKPAFPS